MDELTAQARDVLSERLLAGSSDYVKRGNGTVTEIFDAVASKRWRRSALSQYSAQDTFAKIDRALDSKSPLVFTIPFGGYKSWRVDGAPFPNWAEVFFVAYLRNYVRHVGRYFPYGVRAEFTYVSGVIDLVSNHDPSWQPRYLDAFGSLLRHHADEPEQLAIVDIGAVHGLDSRAAVLDSFKRLRPMWQGTLTPEQQARLRSAERNFYDRADEGLPEKDHEARVLDSAIFCEALDSLEARREYNKFGPRIQLVFGRQPQPAVHIGSCETSTSEFWVSRGVLERHSRGLLPRMAGHTSRSLDVHELISLDDAGGLQAEIGSWLPATCEVV